METKNRSHNYLKTIIWKRLILYFSNSHSFIKHPNNEWTTLCLHKYSHLTVTTPWSSYIPMRNQSPKFIFNVFGVFLILYLFYILYFIPFKQPHHTQPHHQTSYWSLRPLTFSSRLSSLELPIWVYCSQSLLQVHFIYTHKVYSLILPKAVNFFSPSCLGEPPRSINHPLLGSLHQR